MVLDSCGAACWASRERSCLTSLATIFLKAPGQEKYARDRKHATQHIFPSFQFALIQQKPAGFARMRSVASLSVMRRCAGPYLPACAAIARYSALMVC